MLYQDAELNAFLTSSVTASSIALFRRRYIIRSRIAVFSAKLGIPSGPGALDGFNRSHASRTSSFETDGISGATSIIA